MGALGSTLSTTSIATSADLAAASGQPGGTDVAIADGGTGASTASGARTNLGISAANTPFTPNGSIAATDVQAAIQEVRDEATGGASGALVLLEQHTASASATLDFTTAITSTYDEYLIEFVNVIPATNNAILWMRMSTNGGSSYDTSGIYDYTSGYVYSGGVGVGSSATNSTKILLMDATSNSANYGVTGSIRLFNPLSTALYKQIVGQVMRSDGNGLGLVLLNVLGVYKSATAVNAIRLLFDSVNMTSGTIRVYGIAK